MVVERERQREREREGSISDRERNMKVGERSIDLDLINQVILTDRRYGCDPLSTDLFASATLVTSF